MSNRNRIIVDNTTVRIVTPRNTFTVSRAWLDFSLTNKELPLEFFHRALAAIEQNYDPDRLPAQVVAQMINWYYNAFARTESEGSLAKTDGLLKRYSEGTAKDLLQNKKFWAALTGTNIGTKLMRLEEGKLFLGTPIDAHQWSRTRNFATVADLSSRSSTIISALILEPNSYFNEEHTVVEDIQLLPLKSEKFNKDSVYILVKDAVLACDPAEAFLQRALSAGLAYRTDHFKAR
jgi:hypothetical protein